MLGIQTHTPILVGHTTHGAPVHIIAGMPEPPVPPRPITRLKMPSELGPSSAAPNAEDKMLCERCGGDMYRMHAVWRCAACGFKTDCCGW